jgi:hypothetical protein
MRVIDLRSSYLGLSQSANVITDKLGTQGSVSTFEMRLRISVRGYDATRNRDLIRESDESRKERWADITMI